MYWILFVVLMAQDGTESMKRTDSYKTEKECKVVEKYLTSGFHTMEDRIVVGAKCKKQRLS